MDYEGGSVEYLLGKEIVHIILKKITFSALWMSFYEDEVLDIGISILSLRRNKLVVKSQDTEGVRAQCDTW